MFVAPSNPPTPDLNNRTFTFSPAPDEIGSQALPNEHTEKLCEILLSYGFYEKELGELSLSDLIGQAEVQPVQLCDNNERKP